MPNAVTHPSAQDLAAFALGKLPEAASTIIADHLEKCPSCRQTIESLPADSFLARLRAANPDVSSLPARTVRAGGAANTPTTRTPSFLPLEGLPPNLARYAKFRFLRELGRGGMGVVYQAEQTVMGRLVAVKVINPSVLAHPDALPRFQGEVKAAAKLDHPNIVRAHDAEQVGGMHLLVMEYVEGTSLAELVAKNGPQPIAQACHYICQAARGLHHAFEHGMVHRDIKPQNLMVNVQGQVKILDFGLARMRGQAKTRAFGLVRMPSESNPGELTPADTFMGTPAYVSPEQATDAHSADTRADIYSLGCTLFFLLTGRAPFQADTAVQLILAHREQEPPALQEVRADVPAELAAVVARMLAKDPARRFQTPIEVAQELAAFEGIGKAVVSAKKKAKPARQKWWIGGSVAAGLLLGLAGLWSTGVFDSKPQDGAIIDLRREPLAVASEKPAPPLLLPAEDNGFVPLFNGKDLEGWFVERDDPKSWEVKQGALVAHGSSLDRLNYLQTLRDYGDFILRLEFNLDDHALSGVVLRAVPDELLPHPFGQRLREHPVLMLVDQPTRGEATGTLHWILDRTHEWPKHPAELSPPGSWNQIEIAMKGHSLRASVNDKTILDITLAAKALFKDGTVPALNRPKGRIGLLKHTGTARFRNVLIKELMTEPAAIKRVPSPSDSAAVQTLRRDQIVSEALKMSDWPSPARSRR
ncbi:MAG TPA: protein kinase [Gemmataceae bacterium]|jgi:predicted Ser/Thr protein kinase